MLHSGAIMLLAFSIIMSIAPVASQVAPGAVTPESFGAVGDGVADDTAAWQRAAGSGRNIAARGSYLVNDTILLTAPGVRVTGPGRIIATANLRGKSLLHSTANDCLIEGLELVNPSEGQTVSGPISAAIRISADRCRVIGNTIDRFQNGIVVSAEGEYYDTLIQSNVVRNVIGAGGGPRDVMTMVGEDRGDGIVSWGSRTRIIDNRVSAKPGTDARIGIHVEGLAVFKRRPASPTDESGAEIIGNRVEGPFRRGIVNEALRDVIIADNDVVGGNAWWGIAVVQDASDTLVTRNRVTFDRTDENRAGHAWSPWPAAIHLAGYLWEASLRRIVVRDNDVRVTRAGGAAIQVQIAQGNVANYTPMTVADNRILFVTDGRYPAISLQGGATLDARSGRNTVSQSSTQAATAGAGSPRN